MRFRRQFNQYNQVHLLAVVTAGMSCTRAPSVPVHNRPYVSEVEHRPPCQAKPTPHIATAHISYTHQWSIFTKSGPHTDNAIRLQPHPTLTGCSHRRNVVFTCTIRPSA